MKVVALISGGKDSCYAMQLARQYGHEVVALANLLPTQDQPDDLNSYMYQTVGHQLVEAYATCTGLPLFRKHIQGHSTNQGLQYSRTEGDEVEDLFCLLSYVKDAIPSIGAVTSGAIASDYQRLRVESVCARLQLISLAYLWHQPQRVLLRGMIESGLHAVLVKVAALGLDPYKHLGKSLATLEPYLLKLSDMYGLHPCGEGGEYETLTLDCPLFTHACIVLDNSEVVIESEDAMAPVAYLRPLAFHIQPKPRSEPQSPRTPTGSHVPAFLAAGLLANGQTHLKPTVHVVPDTYEPGMVQVPREGQRTSLERRKTGGTIRMHIRQEADYVQATCWCALPSHTALSTDITENDAGNALLDTLLALQARLHDIQLHLGHALYVHLLLANMGHFAAVNNVYCQVVPTTNPPSRTCVQMPLPTGVPVIMDVLLARHACAPDMKHITAGEHIQPARTNLPDPKHVLHVQSISSWAPSCIGPYSQATGYNGLLHIAGAIPLHPGTMTVGSSDVAAQLRCAVGHIDTVAVALRTHARRTAMGVTVYYNESIGHAGREILQRTMAEIQDEEVYQNTLPKGAQGTSASSMGPRSRELGPLQVDDDDDDYDSQQGDAAEGGPVLDPYLQVPDVKRSVRSNVVFVAVPALPRGCLVEVQSLLMDSRWLEAIVPDTTSDADSDAGADKPPAPAGKQPQNSAQAADNSAENTGAGLSTNHNDDSTAADEEVTTSNLVQKNSQDPTPWNRMPSDLSRSGRRESATSHHTPEESVLVKATHHRKGSQQQMLSPHSTQASVRSSVESDLWGDLTAEDTVAGVAAQQQQQQQPPTTSQPPNNNNGQDDNVMVTTVHCKQYGILKSLYHLPLDVFSRPAVGLRLRDAVRSVLAGYGVSASDVVQIRAWYDLNKVGSEIAAALHTENVGGWHVSWMPCLHVGTTVCTHGMAAVLELLARVS